MLVFVLSLLVSSGTAWGYGSDGSSGWGVDKNSERHRDDPIWEHTIPRRERNAVRRPGYIPELNRYEVGQIGAGEVLLELDGRGMPEPEVTFYGNMITVALRDTKLRKDEVIDYAQTVTLMSDMRVIQSGPDVLVEMRMTRPFKFKELKGVAPADVYELRLLTESHQERIRREAELTKPIIKEREPSPFDTNTKITLDLRDTELRDVFRMLSIHLKKNIIIDPSLPPDLVTMTLKNVPLSEVFEYLVTTYDISWHTIGGETVVIGTHDGLSKLAGREETRMFRIAYGDVKVVQGLLANMTKIPTDKIVIDERQRALYVTSNPDKLDSVANVLQKVDKPGRQVMIYARIFEFTNSALDEVEASINAVYNHWWLSYTGSGGMRGGYADDNRVGRNYSLRTEDGAILPNNTQLITPMHGIWREFDGAFRALERRGNGKTLASPSVITIDGQQATVNLTEDYPYISARDDAGNPTWSTQQVGPQLTLTPKVGRDDSVNLTLNITTGSVLEMITGSTGEAMPRTSNRNVSTNVTVHSGEPFVVGGLFQHNKTKNRYRVPVLGHIPLLGELFTYRYNENSKTQVVMVVIPYILDTPDVAVEQEIIRTHLR